MVENAIYHGRNDGTSLITISIVQHSELTLKLEVGDNGPGVDEVTIEQILEGRYESSTIGMGIGLSYVQRLLERFYGDSSHLEIISKIGEGTRLSVIIPLTLEEEHYD